LITIAHQYEISTNYRIPPKLKGWEVLNLFYL
jgi:hypothetical protein